MNILVSNIGSTSFKFRLFQMADGKEREVAVGQVDRIGQSGGTMKLEVPGGPSSSEPRSFDDHAQAITHILDRLLNSGVMATLAEIDAVAFKAVLAGDWDPVALVDEDLLKRMEDYAPIAPAHNPAYIAAMRMFRKLLPSTPLVAAFEPGFHQTNPLRRRLYAVSPEWAEKHGVKRYGFHGASHRYIACRTVELMGAGQAKRIISCHLGGSSSICAIQDGESVATSMGLSPQSGLPQSSRVGNFDVYGLNLMAAHTGRTLDDLLAELGAHGGLEALSGVSADMRDIENAAEAGDERAKLTIDLFVTAARDYVGAYLVELGGADAIVFTGGIGVHRANIRRGICQGMEFLGISLDEKKNSGATGECRVETSDSRTAIWVMPTNEELIVARQAAELLSWN